MQYFGFARPSFGIKTYGFGESSSKLQADFTTGTYKSSGATKTFADLFTFNRAGTAWLVKDTGLQEYAADVPRLDKGLLIEQSATNAMLMSDLNSNSNYSYTQQADGSVKITCIKATTNFAEARLNSNFYPLGTTANHVVRGVHFKEVSKNIHLGGTSETSSASAGINGFLGLELSNGWSNLTHNWLKMTRTNTVTSGQRQVIVVTGGKLTSSDVATSVGDYVVIDCVYASSDNHMDRYATPIKAINTPVTRPADFLLNKITGTTVTGDWDSTLTLSIVAGKLVHSGYGRIRSLEIN